MLVCLPVPQARATFPILSRPDPEPSNKRQDHLALAETQADLRQLRQYLESTHPDPYLRSGGMLAFRKRFADAEASLPPEGLDRAAFCRLLEPLLAQVGDGHTVVYRPTSQASRTRIWVEVTPIDHRLVVTAVFDPSQTIAMGATLEAVEGLPFAVLAERMGARRGSENLYTNLEHLAEALTSAEALADLLERPAPVGHSMFKLRLPDGTSQEFRIPVGGAEPRTRLEAPTRLKLPPSDAAGMASGFLDEGHRVGYFKMGSSMRYREAFEDWRASGSIHSGDLDAVVRAATGREPTGDTQARIAQVPSVAERLAGLFTAMKAEGTPLLVVDLRENEGGNSLYADILEYFLHPLDTILGASQGYQIPRYSECYFQGRTADTLEKVRARLGPGFQLGDYDFSNQDSWIRNRGRTPTAQDLAQRRRFYAGFQRSDAPTFGTFVDEDRWNALCTPKVVVLTSARTYSAGFDAVLRLRAHGAKVVGVPSSQAANCFIDTVGFELTCSHLRGQIPFKWSVGLPDDPDHATLFHPDRELTYATFKALAFDPNAALLLALD